MSRLPNGRILGSKLGGKLTLKEVVVNYVHIPGKDWRFRKDKILQVTLRPSIMYWKYPYMMEIVYSKRWTETSVMYTGKVAIPVEHQHDTKTYEMKLEDIDTARSWLNEWEAINVSIKNKIQ